MSRKAARSAPCTVDIVPPVGRRHSRTGASRRRLTRDGAPPHGFGRYRAANYDELIDHPVEMSDFALAAFAAGGVRHEIAVTGRQQADLERLARDLARVCQWQIDLFGGAPQSRAPFDRYLFQITAVGDGYGGLEHRSSTSLAAAGATNCRCAAAAEINDGYLNLLGLASHEYFHSWNVKRIKPAAFTPYDLTRENYTRQLWAFEGITSYYDDLALVRSGAHRRRALSRAAGTHDHQRAAHARPASCRASPIRASTRGSSSIGRTRTRPTPSSAITRRARSSRSRSI